MQNKAAMIITGRPYEIATKEIFRDINWQSLDDHWEKNKLIFMHNRPSVVSRYRSVSLSMS